jgi:hypothetical protein
MTQKAAPVAGADEPVPAVKRTPWALFPILIGLPDIEIEIQADRRLAFEVLTAFGASQGSEGSSRVLFRDGERLLVEFRVPVRGLLGIQQTFRTVEWVTLQAPNQIDSEGVTGPLPLLRDRFTLEERGACTKFRYQSTFGVRGWIPGWLVGMLYVRPTMKRFMRNHAEEVKQTIEARAARCKIYPQRLCHEEPTLEPAQ